MPIRGGSLPPKTLCLTFDDGPGPCTLEVAHYLAEENIKARFFVVGKHVLQRPDAISKLRELGHSLGNHSYSHLHLTASYLSVAEIVEEVTYNGGDSFFRPPYGAWTPRLSYVLRLNETIDNQQIGPINWDVGGFDFQYWRTNKSPEACAKAYRKCIDTKKKGIVLFHDHSADLVIPTAQNRSLQLMQTLIPQLRDDGYAFVPLQSIPFIENLLQGQDVARRGDGPSTSLPARPPGKQ